MDAELKEEWLHKLQRICTSAAPAIYFPLLAMPAVAASHSACVRLGLVVSSRVFFHTRR